MPILGVPGIMSAFPESGRSETAKTVEIRVRVRPEGDIDAADICDSNHHVNILSHHYLTNRDG